MSGAYFNFKKHKCRDCDKMAFGKALLCGDCKVNKTNYNYAYRQIRRIKSE